MSKFVLVVINIKGSQELLSALAAVNELPLRDGSRVQDAVPGDQRGQETSEISPSGIVHLIPTFSPLCLPLAEVPIKDTVGEALAADADAF